MILTNFLIAIYGIFLAPLIILSGIYKKKPSLIMTCSFILSCSFVWVLFLLNYYFELGSTLSITVIYSISIYSIITLIIKKDINFLENYLSIIIISIILLYPLLISQHLGENFTKWDAVVSWNRWAIDLFENKYQPYNSAYPVFFPALWSIIYKLQETNQIWWTAQSTLFILPITVLAIIISLYRETKNITFILMLIFIYPYLVWGKAVDGYMDMPVMLTGFISLLMLYASEIYKKDFHLFVSAAFFLAGIASIIKQAGLFFLIFCFIYIAINRHKINSVKIVFISAILSSLYFISYLFIFIQYQDNPIANLSQLELLSNNKMNQYDDIIGGKILYLFFKFFSYPNIVGIIITLCITIVGYMLFFIRDFREVKNYRSICFLSAIAFFVGSIIWANYFSYSERNSIWTKSFLIIFSAIIIKKSLPWIIKKYSNREIKFTVKVYYNYIFSLFILISLILVSMKFNDDVAFKIQKKSQSMLGDVEIALKVKELLKFNNNCVSLYTNYQIIAFNYYLAPVKNRIKYGGWPVRKIMKSYFTHQCLKGRYILLIPSSINKNSKEWKKLQSLDKRNIIKRIDLNNYLYFIPANVMIKETL